MATPAAAIVAKASRRELSACMATDVRALLAWGAKAAAEATRVATRASFMVDDNFRGGNVGVTRALLDGSWCTSTRGAVCLARVQLAYLCVALCTDSSVGLQHVRVRMALRLQETPNSVAMLFSPGGKILEGEKESERGPARTDVTMAGGGKLRQSKGGRWNNKRQQAAIQSN